MRARGAWLRAGWGLALGAAAATSSLGFDPEALLEGRQGMLLAMQASTGRLLLRLDRRAHRGPAPVGSLVKPLGLLAWSRGHAGRQPPRVRCFSGGPPACWYPPGHGVLDLTEALAVSCNAWFRGLAEQVSPEALRAACLDLGWPPPPDHAGDPDARRALVGLDAHHRVSPLRALAGLSALWDGRLYRPGPGVPLRLDDPDLPPGFRAQLRAGLRRAATQGTGRAAGRWPGLAGLACKTGTAARLDERGDVMPRGTSGWFWGALGDLRVLVQVEPGTGSRHAAPLGARLLHLLRSRGRPTPRRPGPDSWRPRPGDPGSRRR